MKGQELLIGKRILIVDDEEDILESLKELLHMCDVITATNYQDAEDLMEVESFDMAVFDIMGVDGYKLLNLANEKDVPAVMLTAQALSTEDTIRSFREGAALYIPKEEMTQIARFLADVFEAKVKGKHPWWRWIERFADFYERRFSHDWRKKEKDFFHSRLKRL